jgi:hypothetical protein
MKNNRNKIENKIKENFIKRLYKNLPKDNNPKYGGLINFASNGVENETDAFNYGFRLGYITHQDKVAAFFYSEFKKINKESADKFFKYYIAPSDGFSCSMFRKFEKILELKIASREKCK